MLGIRCQNKKGEKDSGFHLKVVFFSANFRL